MLESYRVGVSLVQDSAISQQLGGIIAQYERLDRIIKNIRAGLGGMGDLLREVGRVGDGMTRAADATSRMGAATAGASRTMGEAAAQAQTMATSMERAASASRALVPYQGGGALVPYANPATGYVTQGNPYTPYGYLPAGRPGASGPAGGAVAPFVPPTGFTLGGGSGPTYTGPTPPGGGTAMVQSRPFGNGGNMPPLVPPFGIGGGQAPSGHDFALAAMGYGFAGRALTGFVGDVIHAGMNTGQAMYRLRATGFTEEETQKALENAKNAQRNILGVTTIGALEAQRDLALVMRDPTTGRPDTKEITHALPDFLRMSTVLAGFGKGGELAGLLQTIQQGELLGLINNPKQLRKLMFLNEFVTMRSGGQVGPSQVLQYLRSGGGAAQGLSTSELFADAAPIILSMGSARAGTGLRGFYQQFSAGKQSDAGVALLNEMGLLVNPETGRPFTAEDSARMRNGGAPRTRLSGDRTDVLDALSGYKAGIGQYRLPGNVLVGWEMLNEGRMFEYIEKILLPHIRDYNVKQYGFNNVNLESSTAISLASRIPGGNMLADMIRIQPMIEGYRASYREAIKDGSVEKDYNLRLQTDPTLKMQGLQAAWSGFLTALANGPVMDAATRILQDLTRGLNALGKAADEHKGIAAMLVATAGGLGALAVAAAGLSAAVWLGRPMARAAGFGGSAAAGAAAASVGRGGRGLAGVAALGGAVVAEGVGAPDWITNGLLGAGLGATAGAALAGVGALPGAAAGFIGGALWNAPIPFLSERSITGDRIGAAPVEENRPVNLTGTVNLDGRRVGEVVASRQADAATLPPSGPSAGDIRMTIPSNTMFGAP